MRHDVEQCLRSLRRDGGFTLAVVVTLAVGIGATSGIFSVVHGVLLSALPYPDGERLVRIWETDAERGEERGAVAAANLADWRTLDAFSALAGYRAGYYNLAGRGEPTRVIGAAVTPGFFHTLGLAPRLGRAFTAAEGVGRAAPAVVLSHHLWQTAFAADPAVVGSTVRIEDEPFTVVGVADRDFRFPDAQFDLWVSWVPGAAGLDRSRHQLQVVGRLAEGVGIERAREELEGLARALALEHPETNRGRSVHVLPLREELVGDLRPLLSTLFLAVVFVFLVACANVANLVLARSLGRRRAMAVCVTLGAGRARLFRQAWIESALLTSTGAAVGLGIAWGGIELLHALRPDLPRGEAVALDATVFAFAVALALASATGFASLPLLGGFTSRPMEVLKAGGDRAGTGRGESLRAVLVVCQIALAFVLLLSAGLLVQGFGRLQAVEPGFDTRGVLKMDVSLPLGRYAEPQRIVQVYGRILDEVAALPGVESVAVASSLPMSGSWASRSFVTADPVADGGGELQHADYRMISTDYPTVLGVPLLAGRGLGDSGEAASSVLVNVTLAKRCWPGQDPVGRRISFTGAEGPWLTVRGVVGDVRQYGLAAEVAPEIYQHFREMPWPWPTMSLVVRTSGAPLDLAPSVRARVWTVDPDLPVTDTGLLADLVGRDLARPLFTMLLMNLFAAAALLLAVVGIYGVTAYWVRRRGHEIGIRMALGARREQVQAMVLRQGLRLSATGLVLGLLLAAAVTAIFRSRLLGIESPHPLAVVGVVALLAGAAVAASYLPARRATRIPAVEALREP